tara:strand:+ start:95 stop:793 length:699 start_codon:yes stop_codon:yes gene_type:complete
MSQNYPLLPPDEELDSWQLCMKDAIIQIQGNAKPYQRGSHSGCTEHIYYQGSRVGYSKGYSYCCGATYEAFIKAWIAWNGEEKESDNITIEQAKEMRAHFFVYNDKDQYGNFKYSRGAAGGIEWLAQQPGLNQWLQVETTEDPKEVRFGDFIQMQFVRDPMSSGHSVIGLGTGTKPANGSDIVLCWSSNNYYDTSWEYSRKQPIGNGWDYYFMNKVRDGFKRKFHIARIIGD